MNEKSIPTVLVQAGAEPRKIRREGRHRSVDTPRRKRLARREPTMGRTKTLLLAALRVWELKNGFANEPQVFNAYPTYPYRGNGNS